MTTMQQDSKAVHLAYYIENLDEVTDHLEMLGEVLVKNVIEYMGEANFLRVHRTLKEKKSYRSIPSLRDEVRQAEFISNNAGLIKKWFYALSNIATIEAIKDVVKDNILKGKLVGCPYELSDVAAIICSDDSPDEQLLANRTEIQDWYEVFCAQRMVDLVARQGSLVIEGVSGEIFPWQMVRLVILDEELYVPNHRELSSACMKTMVFLITDSFNSYLSKIDSQQ